MTAPEDAIRARRRLTNKLIAAHESARLKPFFDANVTLITGEGSVISGAAAVIDAFAAQFRDPSFVTYERLTETVRLDQAAARAAERGGWIATWRDARLEGDYLAVWKKQTGQWVIESELFVTLQGEG